MPNYDSTARQPFAHGGLASEKMKSEVKVAAKKKRDRLQARHVSPGGGGKYKYGPHKVDVNRRATEALLGKGKVQEKIIKLADKVDKKLDAHYKKKAAKKKMQKRAKKLTAYEGIT